jgi:glutamate-1-semialdehyde 2,1-aminomutase
MYVSLSQKAKRLMDGFSKAAASVGLIIVTDVRGSMFGFFFSKARVRNFDDALNNDTQMFAKFHQAMLRRGIYLACSSFETGFISTAITDEMIEESIKAAYESMEEIVKG